MQYKKSTKSFFVINLVIVLILTIGLAIYDPLHLFHKSWISSENRFHGDMRMQAAGIINNYEFDAIIVGTSMLKGTSSLFASETLGGHFVNISPNGASIAERKYLIDYAIENKDIRAVILSFDTGLDQNLIKSNTTFPVTKFNYLYDELRFNDVKAYWNYKFLGCFLILSTSSSCYGNKRELQRPLEWFEKLHIRNSKISGMENWVHAKEGRGESIYSRVKRHLEQPIKSEASYNEKLQLTREIINESLFSTIRKHENVNFYVVFPPYSRFLYALWKNKNPYKYQLYLETIRYLVNEGDKLKNLTIYSFDNMTYLDDLNNYRDMRHYNTDMNKMMLSLMAEQKGIITSTNVEDFIEIIDKKNASYELDKELNYLLNSYK